MDLIDRTKYRKNLLAAYDDVSMEFDVLDSQPTINAIPIPEGATNGDMIKAMFPKCQDRKARFEEDDGEVYEVHFVHLWDSMAVNKYDENWWNSPYKRQVVE